MPGSRHYKMDGFSTHPDRPAVTDLPLRIFTERPGRLPQLRLLQRLERVAHVGIEAGAATVEMGEDRLAHPRVPEFFDMVGNIRHRLVVALALKEPADLIGHVDQAVRRHG